MQFYVDTIVVVCIRVIVATISPKVQVSSRSDVVAMDPCSVQQQQQQCTSAAVTTVPQPIGSNIVKMATAKRPI